jgi:hypothetical protein
MNYTSLFYWLVVADNAKGLFLAGCWLFGIVAVLSVLANFIISAGENKKAEDYEVIGVTRKWIWWSVPFFFLFASLNTFTPSKKDALLIVAGGQTLNFLTTDKSAKQLPSELTGFLLTEIKNLAKESEVDLNISTQKDKILKEVENMTGKELMDRMKNDSTFAKIIQEK